MYYIQSLPDFIWEMPALEKVMVDKKLEKNLSSQEKNHERWSDDQLSRLVKLRINGIPFSSRN